MTDTVQITPLDPEGIESILRANHPDPFAFLGMHRLGHEPGLVIRTFRPDADRVSVVSHSEPGRVIKMAKVHPSGFFETVIKGDAEPFRYLLKWHGNDGKEYGPFEDPYAFGNVLGDLDMYFLGEGRHRELHKVFGAQIRELGGVKGVSFAVWAPNARRVSVIGDFNHWDGRIHPMRKRIEGGVWEIFIPGIGAEQHYKFEIVGSDGRLFNKSDPYAFFSQHGPSTASITFDLHRYQWGDAEWMEQRRARDQYHSPMSIYEVHLGSWARVPEEGNRFLTYEEFADRLVNYVVQMNFTHIELMPITEFPFDGSWGYQVCGFFAPTSRFGNPDQFRHFVDKCHQAGIGVIVDWVPAHFPKDDHGLARFDGTALYEHADPRQGEHRDWGTLIFNYGRSEVRNFVMSNAIFWLEEYHIDGLRVDAVASMLYLDYSRKADEWVPNRYGGRENLEAISLLRELNAVCYEKFPGIATIAEESTAFTGVSRPVDTGGLGFGFKWNMGWMHDFLLYMSRSPIHRRYHHNEATFSMIYAYHENFILVLSHDEVVHGKGALLNKMPGDRWQQFANLRMFFAWMWGHPGKKLLFQGGEIAQSREWRYNESTDWHLLQYPEHSGIKQLVEDLNRLFVNEKALHELDHSPEGFQWIHHLDSDNSVFAFLRRSRDGEEIVVIVNATPVPRRGYRVGVPGPGFYREILNTDSGRYSGSNIGSGGGVPSQNVAWHGRPSSIMMELPPLATVFFKREG